MIKRIFRIFRKSAPARFISKLSKNFHPWGFEGISLYEVAIFFGRGIGRGELRQRTSSMAYNFFIALFPSIIFLFTLIPFIPINHFQDTLFLAIKDIMPANAFSAVQDTITEIIHKHNSKLLSIGFVVALYFSTSGFTAMMSAFNKSIHVKEERVAWKQQLIAVMMVLILTIVLLSAVAIMVVTQYAIDKLIKNDSTQEVFLTIGQWLILGLLFMFVIGMFYRYGPAQRMHKNFISPGVIAATSLIILTSILFAWYINHFGKYNKLYGSIGSIIVVLIWIYYNSMMLLIGFELDAGISGAREKHLTLLEQEELEIKREEERV
ncbi:MAG: YihY/virulence factor BrkB family protein [Bacteroidetes bacterium]|jgi:membrane protein|nr:YihY/virulence factor BrkB family protein [Bacteroidota bacterium]